MSTVITVETRTAAMVADLIGRRSDDYRNALAKLDKMQKDLTTELDLGRIPDTNAVCRIATELHEARTLVSNLAQVGRTAGISFEDIQTLIQNTTWEVGIKIAGE